MPEYPDVTLPIIHPNGDSLEVLVSRLEAAYDAVSNALDALKPCSPNPRNYYIVPGSMEKALAPHDARCRALYEVMLSMEKALAQHDARCRALYDVMLSLEAEIIGIQYPS